MNRRRFLSLPLCSVPLWAKSRVDKSRLSIITDECAKSPAEAIAFAKKFGLRWFELRNAPGARKEYYTLSEDELRAAAKEFSSNGIKISFLNTGMLKFGLPGTEPARRRQETPEQRAKREAGDQQRFNRRMEDLDKAIRAAHILGTGKVRIFTFTRVAEPLALLPRLAEIIGPMARVAEKEKIKLLVENEGSCNVGSCAEMAALMKLVPSKGLGINWDAMNGMGFKETPFPDGYRMLPKDRIHNVQIKGRSVQKGPQWLDWAAIFETLDKEGYRGQFGLETHIFDERAIEHSHECMAELARLVG
ncbi:MAG: sugar phosphate isomerase/epimerase [Acidobacteria bacterium]|nr:sugar phosphate isomerase/epimerase [Acidobacteriota bacterium]